MAKSGRLQFSSMMRANLILFWVVGFLGLGTLSAVGASSLFPWPLAVTVALVVVGLGSAAAFQFRTTGNVLLLLGGIAMIGSASFLDGVSVWEILNNRQNSALHATTAAFESATKMKEEAEVRASKVREEIGTLILETTNLDNDGDSKNDHLIAGRLAQIESRKADLANFEAQATAARNALAQAAEKLAQADGSRHFFLRLASQHADPATWLIVRAAIFFAIPETVLALLAWSFDATGAVGERRSALRGTRNSAPTRGMRCAARPTPANAKCPKDAEESCFQPLNLNRLRAHLRKQRRAGKIPTAISSREISSMDRSEAIATCLEFGAMPS